MTDINGTVTGIQGIPVSSETPEDGYVLTYDSSNNDWEPKSIPQTGLRKDYFTTNGTWNCPAGITTVLLIGAGGGGAGAAATINIGGGGGGSSLQSSIVVSVTPGTIYNITIGDGGLPQLGQFGHDGEDTTFDTLAVFCGAGGGGRYAEYAGGIAVRMDHYSTANPNNWQQQVAQGGVGATSAVVSQIGARNPIGGFVGGNVGSGFGGGGGAAGPQGNGGNGGNGNSSGTGSNGDGAGNNTGAGGGGAGGSTSGSNYGGAGGSGYLYIVY
jgi:hypothetical protein